MAEASRATGARRKKGRMPMERMPTNRGAATLDDDFADLQGSIEFYIGRVKPEFHKERIVAFKNKKDFKVDKIVPLTKVENPPTRS